MWVFGVQMFFFFAQNKPDVKILDFPKKRGPHFCINFCLPKISLNLTAEGRFQGMKPWVPRVED